MPVKTPKQRERERKKLFRPYANEIGWIVYEWNRLQENLGELFATLVKPKHHSLGIGIWHSVSNDRAQRKMLRKALSALEKKLKFPEAAEDIRWILSNADDLAEQRNDAVHSPFVFAIDAGTDTLTLMPLYFLGNPRAANLQNKDLLKEFASYRERASVLASFAERLRIALSHPDHFKMPERPALPERAQRTKKKSPKKR
jgi:hypothetical protein